MSKPKFKVVTNQVQQTAEIFLYGIIGDFWDTDNPITALELQRLLYSVSEYPRVNLRCNGPGGDMQEGLAMANMIYSFSRKQDIHTYNDGICASFFSLLSLAVKRENRWGAKGSMMMIHSASTGAWGNSATMGEVKEMLEKHDETLAQFYSDATGFTVAEVVEKWFDGKDHWFTSAEAEEANLYTVLDYTAAPMPENAQDMKVDKVAAFYKSHTNITNSDMSLQNFFGSNLKKVAALGKIPTAERTPEQFAEANADLIEGGITDVTLVPDAHLQETVTAAAKVPALENQVTALSTEKTTLTQKVTDLEKTVADQKALLGLPAEEVEKVVTDKIDSTGEKNKVVDIYETSFDREAKKAFGK